MTTPATTIPCPYCGHQPTLISRFCSACGRDRRTAEVGSAYQADSFTPVYRSGRKRANFAVVLLSLITLVSLATLLHDITGLGMAAEIQAGALTDGEINAFDTRAAALDTAYEVIFVATAIAYLAWVSRSVDNVRVLGGGTPMATPRWSIGWWFVPVANLFKPFQIVADLNQRMATPTRTGGTRLVMAWWIAWIGRGIVGAVVVSMLTQGTSEVPHGYLTTAIFIGAVDIVAAILAIAVIRQIQVRADERAMDAGTRGVGSEPSHRTTAAWHVLDHAWEIEDRSS